MWIDADFNLDVIEAFDTLQSVSMGLWKQMQELIATEVDSAVKATIGSRLLLKRKCELPGLKNAVA